MKKFLILSGLLLTGCASVPTHDQAIVKFWAKPMGKHEIMCYQGSYKTKKDLLIFYSNNAIGYWSQDYSEFYIKDCKTGKVTKLDVHEPWDCFSGGDTCEDN